MKESTYDFFSFSLFVRADLWEICIMHFNLWSPNNSDSKTD